MFWKKYVVERMTTVCSELATHQLQMATLSLKVATDESFLSATHEVAGPNTSEVTIFTVL